MWGAYEHNTSYLGCGGMYRYRKVSGACGSLYGLLRAGTGARESAVGCMCGRATLLGVNTWFISVPSIVWVKAAVKTAVKFAAKTAVTIAVKTVRGLGENCGESCGEFVVKCSPLDGEFVGELFSP